MKRLTRIFEEIMVAVSFAEEGVSAPQSKNAEHRISALKQVAA